MKVLDRTEGNEGFYVIFNDYKTKYMVMSREQNTGRIHSVRMDNSTFERGGRV